MPVMQQCPPDSPLMKAWIAYEATDDFKNSLTWALAQKYTDAGSTNFEYDDPNNQISGIQREEIVKGSMWAAFMAGFAAGGGALVVAPTNAAELGKAVRL